MSSNHTEAEALAIVNQIADVDIAGAPTDILQKINDELRNLMGTFGRMGWTDACTAAHEARQPVSSELVERILAVQS